MSKAHSEALRRHWQDPAYRAKQAASRTGTSDALTAEIVRLRDDEHMLLKDIGARLRMSGPAARARYERATTRARIAELERGHAELAQALAVAEEAQAKMWLAAQDACQSVYEEWRAGAVFDNMPLAIAARIALAWREIDHGR